MFFDVQTILMQQKRKFTGYFLCKMQLNTRNRVYLRTCQFAMTTKMSVRVQELIFKVERLLQDQLSTIVIFYYK